MGQGVGEWARAEGGGGEGRILTSQETFCING